MSQIWTRASTDLPFCAQLRIEGGSVLTYCKMRWSTSDTIELYDEPALDRRCVRCRGCLVALGLAELVANAPERPAPPVFDIGVDAS